MDRFRSLLPPDIADEVINAVVDSLSETYRQNGQRHEPDIGDDAQTFGFLCYRNGWFRLQEALGAIVGVRVARPNNSLLVKISDVEIHTYRGGIDETCDIDTFVFEDGSATKASIPATNQLRLPLEGPEPPGDAIESQLRSLAIVHFGNPDDGLCAVWVGAPLPKPAGTSPWEWRETLYVIGRDDDGVKIDDKPPVTPFSAGAEPEVALERRDQNSDGGREHRSAG